jgi:hypothetical protein
MIAVAYSTYGKMISNITEVLEVLNGPRTAGRLDAVVVDAVRYDVDIPLGMLVVMVVFLYLFLVRGVFRPPWHPQSPTSGGSKSARKTETKVKTQV